MAFLREESKIFFKQIKKLLNVEKPSVSSQILIEQSKTKKKFEANWTTKKFVENIIIIFVI
jgi:hypothetical protein